MSEVQPPFHDEPLISQLKQISAKTPIPQMISDIMEILMSTLPANGCALYIRTIADIDLWADRIRTNAANQPVKRNFTTHQRTAMYVCAYDAYQKNTMNLSQGHGRSQYLALPITQDADVVGVIGIMRKRGTFTNAEQNLFQQALPFISSLYVQILPELEDQSSQSMFIESSPSFPGNAASTPIRSTTSVLSLPTGRKRGRPAKQIKTTVVEPTISATIPVNTLAESFFAASREGALQIGHDLQIISSNPAFTHFTGWDNAVIGKRCTQVIRCHDADDIPYCGTAYCPLVSPREQDGTATTVDVRIDTAWQHPAYRDMRIHTVAVTQNTTLLMMNEVGDLLTMMQQRDEFLSEVVHQLRNRLNAVHGLIELVASGHAGAISGQQREMLSYAHTSAIEMMEYIENLLYLMRIDAGQAPLSLAEFTLERLLAEIERYTALEVLSSQVTFAIAMDNPEAVIQADQSQLRQALLNLMTNALKFTPAGGTVTMSGSINGDKLTVQVIDTGLGITSEDLPNIFARNFHSERMAALGKSSGGMGLATARAIIEQHHGMITCTSVVDQGTTFTVTLPIRQENNLSLQS